MLKNRSDVLSDGVLEVVVEVYKTGFVCLTKEQHIPVMKVGYDQCFD